MTHSRKTYYKYIFLAATVYDVVLGVVFTFFYRFAFKLLGIEDRLPNYSAYLSLIGAFLLVIGIAYLLIFLGDLRRNRDLILIGALFKLAYFSVTLAYLIIGHYPHIIFFLLFGLIDLVFFVTMMECYLHIRNVES